jgi:hypothetical protein
LEKEMIAEASGLCAWCRLPEPLDVHHIDEDSSNTVPENLVALCKNCHGKAGKGFPSPADLMMRKRELQWQRAAMSSHATRAPQRSVKIKRVATAQFAETINNYKGVKPPRSMPATDSIEADAAMKSYVQYLIKQYIWCRMEEQKRGDPRRFHPAMAKNIAEKAVGGFSPYGAPQYAFPTVTQRLIALVRRTKWACQTKYSPHSWDEHQRRLKGDGEPGLDPTVAEAEEEFKVSTPYDALVRENPKEAVRVAWRDAEGAALSLMDAKMLRPDPSKPIPVGALAAALRHFCEVDGRHVEILLTLAGIKDRIAAEPELAFDTAAAAQFCALVLDLTAYLKGK